MRMVKRTEKKTTVPFVDGTCIPLCSLKGAISDCVNVEDIGGRSVSTV